MVHKYFKTFLLKNIKIELFLIFTVMLIPVILLQYCEPQTFYYCVAYVAILT